MPVDSYGSSQTLPQSFNRNGTQHSPATVLGGNIVFREENYTSLQESLSTRPQASSMPMSTGCQLVSLPSFGSVFGDGPDNQNDRSAGDLPNNQISGRNTPVSNNPAGAVKRPNTSHHFFSSGLRRDSASTFESVESSPTTTISTIESSLTEPSPSSSPESPTSMLTSSPLKTHRTHSTPVTLTAMELREQFSNSYPSLPGVQGSESPNKKMRNMKNLSVNITASNRPSSQLSKVSLSNNIAGLASSAPPTPAFIVPPPKGPRRKPSNLGLSITTPDSSAGVSGQDRPTIVPQTPSDPQIRTLRALQTVSSGPLFSPTHAPEGGMRLPPMNSAVNSTRYGPSSRPPLSISPHTSFENNISSPITKQILDHVQEECDYEPPLSQEVKSPAYPQGPVCIYDPYVYLYMEPTDIEAAEFDVVINVAREVKNPFSLTPKLSAQDPVIQGQMLSHENQAGNLAGRDNLSEAHNTAVIPPQKLSSETPEEDAEGTAPSTPKAARPQLEYIHIPWDHNTNVVDDLLRLCELIDERVRQQKRVLIHCQCGVSRSASLVVAYGLYKNPHSTVQEAYDAVKNRSRWIGPNMNLIYQLSEFKNKLGKVPAAANNGWSSWRAMDAPKSTAGSSSGPELASSSLRIIPQKSLSAPSQLERTVSFHESQKSKDDMMGGEITPGPLTAPPGVEWSSGIQAADSFTLPKAKAEAYMQPSMRNTDDRNSLSSLATDNDAFEQKRSPPAGAVASDLQNVAKGLDVNTREIDRPAVHYADKGIQVPVTIPPPPGHDDWDESTDSTPKPSPFQSTTLFSPQGSRPLRPQPSLPAGFSSLLNRRQNLQTLPIRQAPPLLTAQNQSQYFPPAIPNDLPPTPSLLSPRAAEFTASPFHRTVAGDLAGSSVFEQGLMSPRTVQEDPRSPHQVGEAPITRNIFDMMDFDKTPK